MSTSLSESDAIFATKIAFIGVLLAPVLFFHFVYAYCGLSNKKVILGIYLFGIISVLLDFSEQFTSMQILFNSFYYPRAVGYSYYVLYPLWMLIVLYAHYQLFMAYRHSEGMKRRQLLYLFIATSVGYSGGAINFLPVFGINIYPYSNFLIPLYAIFSTYAILRYRLMDINIIIKKGLIYSILAALITATYLIFVIIAEEALHQFMGYTSVIATILAAFIIAIFFIPLKNRIQHTIDYLFFKGTLDTLATEKALMHDELMRSERLKAVATLAAGMAHEIKNPLTAIKTFTEHLEERKDDPAFIEKFKRIVGGEVDKINDLVHSLLDFSKPNPLKFETSNINYLLEDTLSLLNNEIIKHKITLFKKYSELPLIQADPNQLKQAFLNLILNAIEAMSHGGELTIETVKVASEEKLGVNIKDTGAGIPQKDLPRIFDPFYSTKNTGTGLGLSITYEIIKKHNGTIAVDSELGRGTVVKIEF